MREENHQCFSFLFHCFLFCFRLSFFWFALAAARCCHQQGGQGHNDWFCFHLSFILNSTYCLSSYHKNGDSLSHAKVQHNLPEGVSLFPTLVSQNAAIVSRRPNSVLVLSISVFVTTNSVFVSQPVGMKQPCAAPDVRNGARRCFHGLLFCMTGAEKPPGSSAPGRF